jgi:hypothetical protein
VDTEHQRLIMLRLEAQGFVEVLEAGRGDRVRAEPFESLELPVGVLFGDEVDERARFNRDVSGGHITTERDEAYRSSRVRLQAGSL